MWVMHKYFIWSVDTVVKPRYDDEGRGMTTRAAVWRVGGHGMTTRCKEWRRGGCDCSIKSKYYLSLVSSQVILYRVNKQGLPL